MAVEQVSVEILRILGLEEADEVDMESYKGFLREKLVLISMGKANLSRDQEIIIQDEFKRIKSKPNTVKVKKTFVDPKAVFNRRSDNGVKYLPPAPGTLARRVIPQAKVSGENFGILENINSLLNNIWKNLSDDEKRKKRLEKDRKAKLDKEEKAAEESSLEKVSKGIVKALEKTFKPVIDIFDRIVKAIQILFLGWVANRLLDWIQDPNNKKTFDAIVDFLSRNAGKLLLLFVMLNNPLVKIVRWLGKNMIKFLVRMIADLTKGKNLLKGIRGGRGAAAALTLGATAATIGVSRQLMNNDEGGGDDNKVEISTFDPETPNYNGGGIVNTINLNGGGFPDLSKIKTKASGTESLSPGLIDKGQSGIDKVNANVTKGEFISSVPAVNTWGVDFYEALNKLGGGTNRPTYSGGRMYAKGGGLAIDSSGGGRTRLSSQTSFSQLRPHHGTGDSKRTYGTTKDYVLYSKDNPNNYDVDVPTPVDAVVKFAGDKGDGYGKSVELVDENGKMLGLFGHFNKLKVSTGQKIRAGKSLGIQGYTGRVYPPGPDGQHLHMDANPSFHEKFINYITSGKAVSTSDDSSQLAQSPEDKTTDTDSFKGITFASEADRKLATAYLKYITQPMGRGLDIRPTIDMVSGTGSGTPPVAAGADVRSGSASRGGVEPTVAAAHRQIASPTR